MSEQGSQCPLTEREQATFGLVLERAKKSKMYKRLDESGRRVFEDATLTVVDRTLEGSNLRTIKSYPKIAIEYSGAEAFMQEMAKPWAEELGMSRVAASQFVPAVRTAAADVLLVLANPKLFTSVEEARNFMRRARVVRGQTLPGRTFHTPHAHMPPGTIRTSLHKGR